MIPQFADKADFQIRFQPFQLYPDLPHGDSQGVDKRRYFLRLYEHRYQTTDPEAKLTENEARLTKAWKDDGLTLARREGQLGNSFDAQRLISFARRQGREDQMIEEIYTGNHEQNVPLSDRAFLLTAAGRAGVVGAEAMLDGDAEAEEVLSKIERYVAMGIDAVPVIMIDDLPPIMGAPAAEDIARAFSEIIARGECRL